MANRRFGGGMGGGPQRGNRSFVSQQQYHGNQGVNPWQGGIAPSNSGNSGLLSQLSTPQQLALALTSLLQPQQQQQNNPPSLLSLNTSPFSGQDQYDSHNRFGSRGRSDFRRIDSYKQQNRNNNWRTETNRRNTQPYKKNTFNKGRSQDKTPEKLKTESKPKIEEKQPEKSGDETTETIDLSVDEGRDEETKEKKRDWKEEKNLSDDKEKQDENVELTEEEKKTEVKDDKKREGRYQGVPAGYLHCFVCNKSMWDGESFQNHLRGKAHKQMLQSLEESFQITVNILRENMRLAEEQKMIELNRMHRNNRNYHRKMQEPQSTCNMCDLKFMGKIIVHRKTEGHQRLKRFLHPSCEVCNKEFPARMEWVEHKFTPEHLRALKDYMEDKIGGEDGAIIVENLELDLEPLLEESLQNEDEAPVLELSDDMTNFQNRIPAYKKSRPVSKESLKPSSGFLCDLCSRFFPSEEIAQAHLKTEKHYYAFVEAAKNKYKRAASEKAEDDDGNWKRRKVDDVTTEESAKEQQDTSINGGNEMYDPEEACNENENTQDAQVEQQDQDDDDDKWAEVDAVCTKEKDEEQGVTVKIETPEDEEEVKTATAAVITNSPRTRRGAAAKNGGVPAKAKRGRK